MKSILIVEDDHRVRTFLAALIGGTGEFTVAAACALAEEALERLEESFPDIILLDINLPGISGLDLIPEIRARGIAAEIVMLTMYEDRDHLLTALKRGATGYILKGSDTLEILKAVQEVAHGGAPMSPSIARLLVEEFKGEKVSSIDTGLSTREREILQGISRGRSEKRLAEELRLSTHTIHTHIKNIYRKLQVNSKAEALISARRRGIV